MADEEEGKNEEELLRSLVEAMASDHIMSFVHTPGFTSEAERNFMFEQLDESLKRATQDALFHDLQPGGISLGRNEQAVAPANMATPYTEERMFANMEKAKALRGEIVIPTAGNTTLAFFLKGLSAARGEGGGRASGPPAANGYSTEELTDTADVPHLTNVRNAIRTAARDLQMDLVNDQFTFGGAVKDDDTGDPLEFPFLSQFEGSPLESNLWLPDIYDDGKVPSGVPKAVKDRLKKLRDDPIFAPLKKEQNEKKRRAPIGKKEGISPITAYYIMRYLSPYLLSTGQVAQALPLNGKIRRIEVSRDAKDNDEFREELAKLLSGANIEGQRNIDEMFPFEPIRTKYRYPEDYPAKHTTGIEINETIRLMFDLPGDAIGQEIPFFQCPEPTDEGVSVTYGLLQKIHAVMSPSRRNSMINDINDAFFEGATTQKFPIYNLTASDTLSKNTANVYIPVRKNGAPSFDYAEVLLALLEADFRGLAKEDAVKIITNRDKNQNEPGEGKEVVSEGATLIVPGVLLLYSEVARGHAFFDINYGFSTKSVVADNGRRMFGLEGFNYLAALADFCNTGDESQVRTKNEVLNDIISVEFECVIQPEKEVSKLLIVGDDDVQFTLTVDNRRLQNGIREHEVERILDRNEDDDQPQYDGADLEILENLNYNSIYIRTTNSGGVQSEEQFESVEAFAETTGEIMRRASTYGAKAFNALGYIVEESMIDSAVAAVDTVEGFSAITDFDRLVIALIGTQQFPGLATVHSAYHYHYLLHQMISPIKNWNVVDSDLFTQGTFLQLESFFDKPAIKALYYMLNRKGYITLGNAQDGSFTFFTTPRASEFNEAAYTGLQNGFAQMVIGYYRLLFAQLRNRLVIARKTKEARQLDETTADIQTLWKRLIVDSMENTPDPKMFALVLRYMSEEAENSVIRIPTWMPVLPDDMLEAKQRKSNENEPSQYLKWAYGSNAVDLEFFAEVAAAYHSSKALSYYENYPNMVKRFVEAVDEDSGHAFLFSILLADAQPDLSPAEVMGSPITVTNMPEFMNGTPMPRPEDAGAGASIEGGGGEGDGGLPEVETAPEAREAPWTAEGQTKDEYLFDLWEQHRLQSRNHINGELTALQYRQNITGLLGSWNVAEGGNVRIEQGRAQGDEYNPHTVFYHPDVGKGGLAVDLDGEEYPDADILMSIANMFVASEYIPTGESPELPEYEMGGERPPDPELPDYDMGGGD